MAGVTPWSKLGVNSELTTAPGMHPGQERLGQPKPPMEEGRGLPSIRRVTWLPGGFSSGLLTQARIGVCNSLPKNPRPSKQL